ncbi:MAG: DUF4421 family protein [Thermonemataceae bacterium]|nr:DUF4421 family protein [Thermonemataceae bacterium]
MKVYLILYIFLQMLFSTELLAQGEYIQTFTDHFLVKVGANNRSLDLTLSPRVRGITQFDKLLWYRPSVQNTIGVGVSFKDIGLSYSFKLAQRPATRSAQGNSKYFDMQLHSLGRKYGYDIYYQNYQGYYIVDLKNIVNNFINGVAFERRDDLRLQNISANFFYVFNSEKFSYRAAFVLDEKQLKNAGSFILTSSLGHFRASADSSFIPDSNALGFDNEAFFKQSDFYTFSATPGYAYTFVSRKGFYLSLSASGLIGIQYNENRAENSFDSGVGYFLKGIGRGAVGYNHKNWILGVTASADIQGMNTRYVQYRTNNLDILAFVAYRIKTKWMEGQKSVFERKKG